MDSGCNFLTQEIVCDTPRKGLFAFEWNVMMMPWHRPMFVI